MMPTLISKEIVVQKDIDDDIMLRTYPNELRQVILNLLKNAQEALLETDTKMPKIFIAGVKKGDSAYLSIEDNAGGVSIDIQEKIFKPYFSTKIKKDGTGLGLYMSKTIIEEHCGGTLSFQNSSKGALFNIILPLKHKEPK